MAHSTSLVFVAFVSCFWTFAVSSKDPQEVMGKPGDDVMLWCQCLRDVDVEMLKWIRPDVKSEGFVFFFREDRVYVDGQHQSYQHRVELKDPEMKDGDVSVILKNININDTGTYECYVGNGGKTEFINTINLTVVDPGDAAGHIGGGDNEDEYHGQAVEPGTNKEDGGDKDGGNKDGGDKDGGEKNERLGLVAVLSVVFLSGSVAAVFLIHRKCKRQTEHV